MDVQTDLQTNVGTQPLKILKHIERYLNFNNYFVKLNATTPNVLIYSN